MAKARTRKKNARCTGKDQARKRRIKSEKVSSPGEPAISPQAIVTRLRKLYPDATCELHWENPFQLLIATVLSAQATDKKVNEVTPSLFAKYADAGALSKAQVEEVAGIIRQLGFFRKKAEAIVALSQRLVDDYDGKVPDTMDELLTLPRVARKTANVVLGTAFGKATGIVVDTHVLRLASRIGLSGQRAPDNVEQDLMNLFSRKDWVFVGHALIWHGRRVCDARKPRCGQCALADLCPKNGVSKDAY